MLKWIAIAGVSIGAIFAAKKLLAIADPEPDFIEYAINSSEPYGKVWRTTRPPGLPANVRHASVDEGAAGYVVMLAREESLGENFVRTIVSLADKESSMTFARPANNFNSTIPRPITAWGVFQWNADAWDRLGATDRGYIHWTLRITPVAPASKLRTYPWQQTALQEVEWPIRYYGRVWQSIKMRGGRDIDAARGTYMWHSGPTRLRRYLDTVDQYGWSGAWREIGQDLSPDTAHWYREKTADVDEHLRAAGVTS